jgi:sulfur carrier protein
MMITLNGEEKQVPDNVTIHGLLEFLNIQHQRVAVELNLEIVKKDKYGTIAVKAGDSLEIVSFMSGGCPIAECGVRNENTEVTGKNLR